MSESLTLGSLFDGSGGFPLAGMMAGITPVWASEIEPFPIRVTQKRIPQMKHYGDISKMNGGKIEPVDIITFGSPCFPAGTLVLTDRGYVEIENIKRDMKVLTHKGRWRKVTAIGSKMGETVILKGNHYGLECTPNHPIYSAKIKHYYPRLQNRKRADIRLISEDKNWTPAENMQSKLWAVPNKIEKIPITKPCYTGDYREKVLPSMVNDGVSYEVVRSVLGHRDPNVIQHYAALDINNLRRCALPTPEPTGFLKELFEGRASI